MFKKISSLSLMTLFFIAFACSENPSNAASKTESTTKTEKKTQIIKKADAKLTQTLNITGMVCGGCESSIKEAVEKLEGVESCTADHKKKNAVIVFKETDSKKLSILNEKVIKAINTLGYKASLPSEVEAKKGLKK